MVEFGYEDGISYPSWVGGEYTKVRHLYDRLGLGNKTEAEFFLGGHEFNNNRSFEFLHRHLNWSSHDESDTQ